MNGWNGKRFSVYAETENGQKYSCFISVLLRTFKLSVFKFTIAYIPLAPEIKDFTDNQNSNAIKVIDAYSAFLSEFVSAIKKELPKNLICVRYDVPIDFYDCESRDFYVNSIKTLVFAGCTRLKKSFTDIQPPDTTILDLSKTQEELLSAMKPKWRYNIRLAEKKGVHVEYFTANSEGFEKALDDFYSLYKETSVRDGIAIHSKEYYKSLFMLAKSQPDSPEIRLYLARHENDNLAAIITLFCKKEAVYLYGASGNVKRNLMPAYLLQWNAINDAASYGAASYDFYGMPPVDDEHHPMHGLYRFKTGFGGKIIHRPGSFDVPVNGFYALYVAAERLRAFYHKKIKKLIAGR